MKRDIQLKLQQLKVIIIGWLIAGLLITVYDQLILISGDSAGTSSSYSFYISLAINTTAALIGSVVGGTILVFYVNVKYQDRPYYYTILIVCISFIVIWAFIVLLIGMVFAFGKTTNNVAGADFSETLKNYLYDSTRLKAAMEWLCVVAITQLLLQMNSKFGQNSFWKILKGTYNTPKEEKKIFMFLDINSSTSIAERLGDKSYHAFLKDFFADITYPILDNKGFIYQYVGDEVVIAWSYKDGIENMQCVKCFYDMKAAIHHATEKYVRRYGVVPSFKAGIHSGTVIGGEVGLLKREITYSGNVLNTTSRILSKAGELKEELLASAELISEIAAIKKYISRHLGAIKLKGKSGEMGLSAIMLA